MPITAKLSRKFYQRFGDEVTNELVEWFNSVDTTYRSDLRELNESNFQRFDARLEQRLAEMAGVLRTEIEGVRTDVAAEIADLRIEMRTGFAEIEGKFAGQLADTGASLVKWMFVFWTGMTVTNVGIMFALVRLVR
jgi:hypothetical protein